jgi:uncharacterized protein
MIPKEIWNRFRPSSNPFLAQDFFEALELSQCIGGETGWEFKPILSESADSCLYTFIKEHSYGEFIFDWSWAEAYERHGIPYYPKLTSMIPFTPVTTKHLLMQEFNQKKAEELLEEFERLYQSSPCQSAHFLFLTKEEIPLFRKSGYLIRESIQYHFFNEGYTSFEVYLNRFQSKKAKNVRNERNLPGIKIEKITKDKLTSLHAQRMYSYYISTIAEKNSFDYLNQKFFEIIFSSMKDNILFIEAYENDLPVAGSLFFYDEEKLYGRYWGSIKFIANLHFELCYYQGIEYCIENKLKIFEAGAQGEHKIARGFQPVKTFSAHKLKMTAFHDAISKFIENEKKQIELVIEKLKGSLPFKRP